MHQSLIDNLLQQIESVLYEKSRIDESFPRKLMNIHEQNAFLQPMPGIKSVAELIHHLLVWRRELLSRLKGETSTGLHMESRLNWLPLEELKESGWSAILDGFYQNQQELKDFLADKEDAFLEEVHAQTGYTNGQLLQGILRHDIYHLGQIGITSKLLKA